MRTRKHSISHGALALAVMALTTSISAAPAAKSNSAEGSQAVIVAYKAGMAAAVRDEVERAGGKIMRELGRASAFAVRMPTAGLAALRASTSVDFVEADVARRLLGVQTRTMETTAQPLAAAVDTPTSGTEVLPYGIAMVQANQVHDALTGNRKLCIVDSGFDRNHPDLVGNSANISGVNLTEPVSGTWDSDENSHGTHVAGTIAALGGNSIGVVGVNPGGKLKLHIAKVFDASGSASSSMVMEAVSLCADAGAHIISMSLGGGDPSQAERRVFRSLLNEGVLAIAAAGNGGDSSTSFPAGYEEVMSVGAVDANKLRAGFSQFNNDVEIAAPGVATLSTIPPNIESLGQLSVDGTGYDAAAMAGSPRLIAMAPLYNFGLGTVVDAGATGKVCLIQRGAITFAGKVLNCQNSGGVAAVVYNSLGRGMLFGTLGGVATTIPSIGTSNAIGDVLVTKIGGSATVSVVPDPALYAYFNGTSMATPHVSGVAALVWSHFPQCSAKQIRQVLNASAMEIGRPGKDPEFGFGLVQAKAARDRLAATGCGN